MLWFDEQAKIIIELIARGVEFAAAVIIALAAIEATIKAALIFVRRNSHGTAKNEVRMTIGRWLAVALEFVRGGVKIDHGTTRRGWIVAE